MLATMAAAADADTRFTRDVAPILMKRCVACHGERVSLGGWRTHSYQLLRKSGASGLAIVVPGKPGLSRLMQLVAEKSPAVRMPKGDEPLPASEIATLRAWIAEGAKFDGPDPAVNIRRLLGAKKHPAAPTSYRTHAPVLSLAFTPDGGTIATGGYNEVLFWDAATGALKRRIGGLPQRIHAIVFRGDGRRMLVGGGTPGEYGEAAVVDLKTGKRSVLDTFPDSVLCAAFSADGSRVAVGCTDASTRGYQLAVAGEDSTAKVLWSTRVHSDWVTSISFSPDGRHVASASKDLTVKVHDASTGTLYTTYNGHNKQYGKHKGHFPVFATRFDPASSLAISAGAGPTVQFWNPESAAQENGTAADMEERFAKESHARHIEHGFTQEVFGLVVRGARLFAASGSGMVKQFDIGTGRETRAYPGHKDWVYALDADAAGKRLAAGSYDGEIRVWDAETGELLTRIFNRPRPTNGAGEPQQVGRPR